ncbi:MAG TPA: hypothetical protein VKB36_06345 [Vicinamibacterales bacterium]|nr:hypothetical protein [Vicinamibacterales bacterium]
MTRSVNWAFMVPGGAPTFHRGLSALIELDAEETTLWRPCAPP